MTKIQLVLDSCTVINVIEKPKVASRLKAGMKGKPVKLILCDLVIHEVHRVRGFTRQKIVAALERILKKEIELVVISDEQTHNAKRLTEQYKTCHNGDNKILSLCQTGYRVLVTTDRALLKACEMVGVIGISPYRAMEI